MTSPKTIEQYVAIMKKHGLTYLEVEGVKLVRNPQLEEGPMPEPAERHPRDVFREKEPPSNLTHPDLYPDGDVPYLENYHEPARDDERGGESVR